MSDKRDGWWRDEWGQWHDPHPPDLGYSGVREHRPSLPPHLRVLPPTAAQDAVDEAERIVTAPDPIPSPSEPSGAVLGPSDAVQPGERVYWRGDGPGRPHVRIIVPADPPPDPVKGLRLYARFIARRFLGQTGDEE